MSKYIDIDEHEKTLSYYAGISECEKIIAEEINDKDVEIRDLEVTNFYRKVSYKNMDFTEFKNETILKIGNLDLIGTRLEGIYFICTGGTYILIENPMFDDENVSICNIYDSVAMSHETAKALRYATIECAYIYDSITTDELLFTIKTIDGKSFTLADIPKSNYEDDPILFRKYKFKKPKRKIKVKRNI